MQANAQTAADVMYVNDLMNERDFLTQPPRTRDETAPVRELERLAEALADAPDTILQEVLETALRLCGADSAGISVEKQGNEANGSYSWIATAGEYEKYQHAEWPKFLSSSEICLQRNTPQRFRVPQSVMAKLDVSAPEVTDGLLLPWQGEDRRGTIWVVAHGRQQAFDQEDQRILQMLADFAAACVRQQRRHASELAEANLAGQEKMAAEFSKKLSAPLRTMKVITSLVERSRANLQVKLLAEEMSKLLEEVLQALKRLAPRRSRRIIPADE